MDRAIKTPETHPDHHTVGHLFAGTDNRAKGYPTAYWYCDSYDPSQGYWLTRTDMPERRINVSERAIGRTFREIHYDGVGYWCSWLRGKVDVAKLGAFAHPAPGAPGL